MGEEDTEADMVEDTEADTTPVGEITLAVMPAVRPIAAQPFTTPHRHSTVQVQPLAGLQRLARVLP